MQALATNPSAHFHPSVLTAEAGHFSRPAPLSEPLQTSASRMPRNSTPAGFRRAGNWRPLKLSTVYSRKHGKLQQAGKFVTALHQHCNDLLDKNTVLAVQRRHHPNSLLWHTNCTSRLRQTPRRVLGSSSYQAELVARLEITVK